MIHQLHAQVRIPSTSNLPEDIVVNNFSFEWDDVALSVGAMETEMLGRLNTFYDSIHERYSGTVNFSGARLAVYDRSDPAPRHPIFDSAMTITAASGAPLPREVALCLSFTADVPSGVVAARRRGRVFLGPFNSTDNTNLHNDGAPSTTLTNDVRNAGDVLVASNVSAPALLWGVRSDVDDATFPVISGWVDNAWDTQRSRGTKATARDTFAV